jgi:UDP-glucose:glycoprotein glucosyltransferase
VGDLRAALDAISGAASGATTAADEEVFEGMDHVHPSSVSSAPVVVLSATAGSTRFAAFHRALLSLAAEKKAQYVLRHAPPAVSGQGVSTYTPLAGFGVALDLKNMEYITLDSSQVSDANASESGSVAAASDENDVAGFVFAKLLARTSKAETQKELQTFRDHLLAARAKTDDIKVWDMKDMGLGAVQHVMQAEDPLKQLEEVSQNFPVHAKGLTRLTVDDDLREELGTTERFLANYKNLLLVNGRPTDLSAATFNIFTLLRTLREEATHAAQLQELGLPAKMLESLLAIGEPQLGMPSDDAGDVRVDVKQGSKGAVHFLNNLEKDKQYAQWPSDLRMLLRPSYQLHQIRRNLFNLVLVIDPATDEGLTAIATSMQLLHQLVPIRVGIVLTSSTLVTAGVPKATKSDSAPADDAKLTTMQIGKLFAAAKKWHGTTAASRFLQGFASTATPTAKSAIDAWAAAAAETTGSWTTGKFKEEANKVLSGSLGENAVKKMAAFVKNKGLPVNSYLLNGLLHQGLDIQRGLMQTLGKEQQNLQMMVSKGEIGPKTNVVGALMKGANVYSRFAPFLVDSNALVQRATLTTGARLHALLKAKLPFRSYGPSADGAKPITMIVGADLSTQAGIQLLSNALEFANSKASSKSRVAVVHMATSSNTDVDLSLPLLLTAALEAKVALDDLLPVLKKVLAIDNMEADGAAWAAAALNTASTGLDAARKQLSEEREVLQGTMSDREHASRAVLKSSVSGCAVFVGSIALDSCDMSVDDFALVQKFVFAKSAKKVTRLAAKSKLDSDSVLRMLHMLTVHQRVQRYPLPQNTQKLSSISSAQNSSNALDIVAILDPLTEAAQRGSSVLLLLRDQLQLPVSVRFVPKLEVSEFPLKSFYRFATGSKALAEFKALPPKLLLTLKVHAPESWDVQALSWETGGTSVMPDPDNLVSDTHDTLRYSLKSLLFAGQCTAGSTGLAAPPNGLQLRLGGFKEHGTLVMSNLGYFQFRASPGLWALGIAPGRDDELYEVVHDDPVKPPAVEDASAVAQKPRFVVLRDFYGALETLNVRKRPGKEKEVLLAESNAILPSGGLGGSGLWTSLSSMFSKPAEVTEPSTSDETIHVFSLATGQLYERMLKLMMLSVTKRASMPVKFWLLENFLSPKFKRDVFKLAVEFGFQVQLITYKWPNWLRAQTEKQRIIWGYKILFLDVLFPLSVKKVIYVDADQVVRADMKELWDLDLEGHAYGYTPFCTSRKETLGFQFWREGYWKEHLRGRPYHISALYVVDLVVFRQQTVGDKLRALYDQLSRDKNSLSNLDQDLPNYAQHMVPIFSLPQDWLWCESWCSDATKATSKTIDLCNNPKHKEPKLDMAKRVIDGPLFKESWVELDEMVSDAESRFATSASVSEGAAGAREEL